MKTFLYLVFYLTLLLCKTFTANAAIGSDVQEIQSNIQFSIKENENKKIEDNWHFVLGAMGVYMPMNLGSDKYHFTGAPVLSVAYKDIAEISLNGLKVNAIKTTHWVFGATLSSVPGRKYSNNSAKDPMLEGIKDVKSSGKGGVYVGYNIKNLALKTEVSQVFGGINAPQIDLSAAYKIPLTQKSFVNIIAITQVVGKDYMNKYFGIDAETSVNTGLAVYKSNADISIINSQVGLGIGHSITKKWSISATGVYSLLGSEASNSPLIKQRGSNNGYIAMLQLQYIF